MNQYFHLLGLTSSRQTALIALKTLSKVAEKDLRSAMAANKSRPIGPSICIDNLDIEERVHSHSIRHCSMMFHGTWGYIHHPNPKLLSSLDPLELTLRAYYDALRKVSTMKINLQMLMPTCEEEKHFEQVLKSQLVHAMSQYVAKAANPEHALSSDPPTVETIDPTPPDIQMIQLMSQSDDSAEGTGQVAETLRKQFGLKPKDFVSCVQIMDANLATCKNFNSLRSLCTPSRYAKLRLSNLCFVLGASHTMWNISQAILNAHLGHPTSTHDLGAWHSLHALGIPSKKVIPKKDFTSMMNNIEKVHEASIVYCLRLVITSEEIVMPSEDAESPDQLPKLPTNKWIDILRSMIHSIKMEQGGNLAYQSHKNIITPQSLQMFLRMAHNYNLADRFPKTAHFHTGIPDVKDSFIAGFQCLQQKTTKGHRNLDSFRKFFFYNAAPGDTATTIVHGHATTIEMEENTNNIEENTGNIEENANNIEENTNSESTKDTEESNNIQGTSVEF
ncbi:hypothetical protein PCASD_15178 [Puccinia coronata f. sp. avenae]|uniref:DUF6589 domain-containing protein n=2 Tax=Puccinia coronata f. sp. avenae TaxID=200324 RepID=A0A2N5U9M0_9BASI|nr:hypothetical protein PCASD_15178 [Puccinia coronata f. sp. avenae]